MAPSLVIVGSGIRSGGDLTLAAREEIRSAAKLLYLVAEPVTATWLRELNPSAESLHVFYGHGKPRRDTYAQMAEHVLTHLRAGKDVCVVSYGHPGVFGDPMHESIRRARAEQFDAVMLPGISSIDWLYADLGVDPAVDGCQIFDATAFFARHRRPDLNSPLVLLQVGLIGETTLPRKCNTKNFRLLTRRLADAYGHNHEVVIYEASRFRIARPLIQRTTLKDASRATLSFASTLYVPPRARSKDTARRASAASGPKRRRRV